MKKYRKFVGMLLLAVVLVCLFAGCGMSEEEFLREGDAMVIIIGNHANANRATMDELDELLDGKLENCISRYQDGEEYCLKANVTVIVLDGKPEEATLMLDGKEVELTSSAMSIEKVMRDEKYIISDIKQALMEEDLRADDEEVDLLAAIAEAKIILDHYSGQNKDKHIVIYDSGITTDGFFNMNKIDIQSGTVGEVLSRLPDGAYYDLSGITVTFGGLGNVAGNQMDMREDSLFTELLSAIWREYFINCGAAAINPNADSSFNKIVYAKKGSDAMICVEKDPDSDENDQQSAPVEDDNQYYPFVTAVSFKFSEKEIIEDIIEGKGETPIVLKSVDLGFKGDSAEFKDEVLAQSRLDSYKDVFEIIREYPDMIVYVVGSKAKTTPTEDVADDDLAKARAEAVAAILVKKYQIPAEQIVIIDAGTQVLSWRNAVEFPDGTWKSRDKEAMMNNRTVAIVPSTYDKLVQELKDLGEIQ